MQFGTNQRVRGERAPSSFCQQRSFFHILAFAACTFPCKWRVCNGSCSWVPPFTFIDLQVGVLGTENPDHCWEMMWPVCKQTPSFDFMYVWISAELYANGERIAWNPLYSIGLVKLLRFGEVASLGIPFENEGIIEDQVTKCVFLQGNWIYVFLDPCLVNIRLDSSCRNISFALLVYLRNPFLLL